MTYIITDPCIGTTDKSCIEVCPVDCIYEVGVDKQNPDEPFMLVIDSEECIDCGACEPECPVEAIMAENAVPEKWQEFVPVNKMHDAHDSDQNGPAEEDREKKSDIAEAALAAHLRLNGDSPGA